MRCPHCDEEIQGPQCPRCRAMNPEGAKYCLECGSPLEVISGSPIGDDEEDENDFDFENRILCSDGTCTGIIVDGKCIECGKKHEG